MEETEARSPTAAVAGESGHLAISTRLNSPVTTVAFADQLAQLTPTSRQAKLAVIARALKPDVPAPRSDPERRELLRGSIPQA